MTFKEFKKQLRQATEVAVFPSGNPSAAIWITKKNAVEWVDDTLKRGQTPVVSFAHDVCWLGGHFADSEVTK